MAFSGQTCRGRGHSGVLLVGPKVQLELHGLTTAVGQGRVHFVRAEGGNSSDMGGGRRCHPTNDSCGSAPHQTRWRPYHGLKAVEVLVKGGVATRRHHQGGGVRPHSDITDKGNEHLVGLLVSAEAFLFVGDHRFGHWNVDGVGRSRLRRNIFLDPRHQLGDVTVTWLSPPGVVTNSILFC